MGQHRPVAARESDRHLNKSHPPSAENECKATRDQGASVLVPGLWDDCVVVSVFINGVNLIGFTSVGRVRSPGIIS